VSETSEPQAIQILDDLLGNVPAAKSPVQAPAQPQAAQPATAISQAVPGTGQPTKGPQIAALPSVVPRSAVVNGGGAPPPSTSVIDLTKNDSFETNLGKLLTKDLELAQHDRAMAIALFQTHLDRAEVLDTMQLSMPVATVIGDNTGATLKSLELAMKAGERVHKVAELLVNAQKNGDAAMLAALKMKRAEEAADGDWGASSELPA
jgi:hypothetical protein